MSAIRDQIGEDSYLRLDAEADKEVSLAMQMDLVDQYHQEKYYRMRTLVPLLLNEFYLFQDKKLQITPLDIVRILFKAKLLYATQTEKEYQQRTGGSFEDAPFGFSWSFERERPIDDVIDTHLNQLEQSIVERVLVSEIDDFNAHDGMGSPSEFFDKLLAKLEQPFEAYFKEDSLIEKHKKQQPGLSEYTLEKALRYFVAPSFSYTATGSWSYVYFLGSAYLRTLLNMLRVAGFLYRGQIDFGMWNVEMKAPSSPFIRESGSMGGGYYWEQDTRAPWEKIPDGRLFLSFGYRGLTKIFFDNRTFGGIEKFFLEHKIIIDKLSNPWDKTSVHDIAPALDILSSATQIPDLGAKILQIYCCLEHLFVPKEVRKDNVKYIIGAINALRPDLIPWFNRLYQIRCDYAHKGFVIRDDKTLGLVFESVANTCALLTAKLKQQ